MNDTTMNDAIIAMENAVEALNEILDSGESAQESLREIFRPKATMSSEGMTKCANILSTINKFQADIDVTLSKAAAELYANGRKPDEAAQKKYVNTAHVLTKKVRAFCDKTEAQLNKIEGSCKDMTKARRRIETLRKDWPESNLNVTV